MTSQDVQHINIIISSPRGQNEEKNKSEKVWKKYTSSMIAYMIKYKKKGQLFCSAERKKLLDFAYYKNTSVQFHFATINQ